MTWMLNLASWVLCIAGLATGLDRLQRFSRFQGALVLGSCIGWTVVLVLVGSLFWLVTAVSAVIVISRWLGAARCR